MAKQNNSRNNFHFKYTINSNGCWIWNKMVGKYPQWWYKNKQIYVHRWSYETFVGPIPKNYDVCHQCDTPACVNPKHLFVGTRQDNMNDAVLKGRHARGETNQNKLTEEQVLEIRTKKGKYVDIALDYNITPEQVSNIIRRKSWKHIA